MQLLTKEDPLYRDIDELMNGCVMRSAALFLRAAHLQRDSTARKSIKGSKDQTVTGDQNASS